MLEQFVSYEIALKLKELGFNEPCLFGWCNKGGWNKYTQKKEPIFQILKTDDNPFGMFFNGKNWNKEILVNIKNSIQCSAPLYQQVFDWFANTYFLRGIVSPYEFEILDDNGDMQWDWGCIFESGSYKDYKETRLACLNKLIGLVQNKQL